MTVVGTNCPGMKQESDSMASDTGLVSHLQKICEKIPPFPAPYPFPPDELSRAHDRKLPHGFCLLQPVHSPPLISTHPALTMLNSQTSSISAGFRKLPRSSSIRWLRRSFLHTPKMTTSVRRIRKELSQAPSDGCQPIPAHWHSGNDQRRWKHTI